MTGEARNVLYQLASVTLINAAFVYLGYVRLVSPGPFNLVWMVGVHILIGGLFNGGIWRLVMPPTLFTWSLVSIIMFEVMAHALFDTCLYD